MTFHVGFSFSRLCSNGFSALTGFGYSSGEKLANNNRLNFSPTSGSRTALTPEASVSCRPGMDGSAANDGRGDPSGTPGVIEFPAAAAAVAATAATEAMSKISTPPDVAAVASIEPTAPPTTPSIPLEPMLIYASNVVDSGVALSRDTKRAADTDVTVDGLMFTPVCAQFNRCRL